MIKINCKYCGKEFGTYPSRIKKENKKYCSRNCADVVQKKRIITTCEYCKRIFEVVPWKIKKGGGRYCSSKCVGLSQRKRTIKICKVCGKEFEIRNKYIKLGKGKYCSSKCVGTWISKNYKRENSWNWKGGLKENRKRMYNKLKKDLKYLINRRMTYLMNYSLKKGAKNDRTWVSLAFYNYKQLKRRLKSTMPIGYTWKNFIKGELEIDHFNWD